MKNLLYVAIMCTLPLLVGCEPNNNPDKPSNNSNFSSRSFSVDENGKKVVFSPGNLQYHPKNHLWRFAEKQIDYIGDANLNLSLSYDGWVDLFAWGTGANPTYGSNSTFIDWGGNKIGDDPASKWRTLNVSEWQYLLYERKNASFLLGVAQVDGVNGLILLPDDWECPKDIIFRSGFHSDFAEFQTYTLAQWSKIERVGAVFLPAAGWIDYYGECKYLSNKGYYWSSSRNYHYAVYHGVIFDSNYVTVDDINPNGYSAYQSDRGSVRLVRDI